MLENKRPLGGSVPTARTLTHSPFDALMYNPVRETTDLSDREFYSSDMGMLQVDRVATREFVRQRYGSGFNAQYGRQMDDQEVDAFIRQRFKVDTPMIDYTAIKEELGREFQYYSGDFEEMKFGEYVSGTVGEFLTSAEGVLEEASRIFTLNTASGNITTGNPMLDGMTNTFNPLDTEDEKKRAKQKAQVIASKIDQFIELVPEGMKTDMEELRTKAGDENFFSISAAIAATLSNAPNLAGGFLPIQYGIAFMYSQEKKHSLEAFENLFDVPRILPTREEFTGNDEEYDALMERYGLANAMASVYAAGSGAIEYYQSKAFIKLAGKLNVNPAKLQRQFTTTFVGHLAKTAGLSLENVLEENSQQALYNLIYNQGVSVANEKYGLNKEKVDFFDGFKDSTIGALRISSVLAVPGAAMRGIQAKNYITQTESNLIDMGFTPAQAKEYAREMANAAGNESTFKAVTQEINKTYDGIELAKKFKIEEQKAGQIYDETGLVTMQGEILTDYDFDQFATIYSEAELRGLIRDEAKADVFVNAVYGNMDARREYNTLINQAYDEAIKGEAEEPEEVTPEALDEPERKGFQVEGIEFDNEYEVDATAQTVIAKILNGDYDDNLIIEEGQTVEEARNAAVKQLVEKDGKPIEVEESLETPEPEVSEQPKRKKENKGKRRRLEKQRQKMVRRAEIALRGVAPNVTIEFAQSEQDFINKTGSIGNGYYDMKSSILLNPETATKGTVAHEVVHAVFHQKFKSDENIRVAADRILNDMLAKTKLPAKQRQRIANFRATYLAYSDRLISEGMEMLQEDRVADGEYYIAAGERIKEDINEEVIAELAGILADNFDALQPSLKARIQDFLATIFKGVIPVSSEGRAIELLQVIAGKTTRGERILEEDLALLDEIGLEQVQGYKSEGETAFGRSKFQPSYSDLDTGMTYFYDVDSSEFRELEKDGYITRDRSIRDFADSSIVLHQPDALFSGSISRGNRILVKGKGGMYYPIKYNEQGYFWASTKGGATALLNVLNKAGVENGGTVRMALTSAPRGKEFGSTLGSNAIVDLFADMALDPDFPLSQAELDAILKKASRHIKLDTADLSQIRTKLGALVSTFKQRGAFANEVIREIGKLAKQNEELGKDLLAFYDSIKIYERPKGEVKKGQTQKETSALKIAERQKGDLGTVGLRHIAEMLAEPILKNAVEGQPTVSRQQGGEIYAVVEIRGPLKLHETYEHESYPFAIVSENGDRPVLHILKDRYMWDTAVIDPTTGTYVEGDGLKKFYPTSGVSKVAQVAPQGKAQLSSDYMLNFDRIPQVVEAIKRYFAGEITYEQFVEIQQKFDPIRRFDVLPQLPTAKQMKDVLKKDQAPLVNKKPEAGTIVGLRLDIPAYTKKDADGNPIGQYVVTMHAKGGKAIAYTATARAKNVRMVSPTMTATKIAVGQIAKTSVSVMQGEYIDSTDQENYALAEEVMNDPTWTQIGYNPFRRSFFYVREGEKVGMPVLGADEVVQIGGLVFAKNADVVTPDHPKFRLQKQAQKETLGILRDDAKFQLPIEEDTRLPIATFFSGMGTVELGIGKLLGFDVKATAEIEQGIVDNYNLVHGAAEVPTDILKLKPQTLIDKGVQFIHMSPPCQAFSAARIKGKVTEEDFKLEMKIARKLARIITEVKPKNLTIENAPAYQDSEQYNVIRKALQKAGYYFEELTPNAADYGGNSTRHRLIVRASLTPLPEAPKEHRDGDWYEAMRPFFKDAPVDEAAQFTGGRGARTGKVTQVLANLLTKVTAGVYSIDDAFINPGGDGEYRPQGSAGNALTANFLYDEKLRKKGIKQKKVLPDGTLVGSSGVMRVALPVRTMVREKGLKYTANYYGATTKQIREADENTGFLIKRATTPMYLAYMNLPTDAELTPNVALNRAMLGNGIQGVISKEFIAPMIGKAQLPDDFLEAELEKARQQEARREQEILEEEQTYNEDTYEEFEEENTEYVPDDADDWYEDYVDEEFLYDDEQLEGQTKLTLKEIKILMRTLNLGELPIQQAKRFSTLIANAAKNADPIDVKNLAIDALENDLILSDQQHAMLVYRVTQLRNELNEIRDSIEQSTSQNTIVDLSKQYEDRLAEISLLVRADARSGSATGRALNARRIALNEDYSLVSIIRRATYAKQRLGNTDDLTEEELKNLSELSEEFEASRQAVEDYRRKQETTVRDQDRKAGKLFIDQEVKSVGTKAGKKTLSQKDKLIERMQKKGYDITGFGKSQMYAISPSLATDIREMAKVLIQEGYRDLDDIVGEIRGVLPDVLDFDIYGAISGRIQRIPKTESEARKVLKALTLQSDLMVQINNAMDEIFDPKRVQRPKSAEVQNLRNILNKLKEAHSASVKEDAAVARMLTEISNIEIYLDEISRPIRPQKKEQSERIKKAAEQLFTKRAELRAQDRLLLLRTIIDYGEPPKFARNTRHPQSQRLEAFRTEIKELELQIKEARRIKNDAERKARVEAEQKARLEELSNQVAGWYRANVAPKQREQLNDVQLSIKEKQKLLRQQDRIGELNEILATGRLPEKEKPQITDPMGYGETIEELRQQIRDTEWYQQAQQIKFEEKRKENVKAKIAEQERIMNERDFATYLNPKEKKEIMDEELKLLLDVQARNERLIRRAINDLKPRTTFEQIADWAALPRAFMATADMSAVFRQGFLLGVRHPKEFVKSVGIAAKAMLDPTFASQVMTVLENDEMSLIREGAGLFFSSLDTGLNISEEAFSSKALDVIYKLPGVGKPVSVVMGASERHMVIMLNVMRAAAFDAFVEANPNATQLELKSMAHYINTASGRGDLYQLEAGAQFLSTLMFSPRFAASRFFVAPEAVGKMYKGFVKNEERAVAEEIAKQWASLITTYSIVFGFALLAGAEVGDDPEESDFGLIKFGRTRMDLFAGMGPNFRLLAKASDAAVKRLSGEEVKVDITQQALNTFFKYKASPWISGSAELLTGKRYVTREDIAWYRVLGERAMPISLANVWEGIENDHAFNEIATELAGEFVGLSMQTRTEKKKKKVKRIKLPTY